jgi:hypothetical protein
LCSGLGDRSDIRNSILFILHYIMTREKITFREAGKKDVFLELASIIT